MRPAVFLDRDGVINQNRPNYVRSLDEVKYLPGVFEALRLISETEFVIVVVTNQSAIGRGLMSIDDLEQIHDAMQFEIEQHGGRVDGFYYCPDRPGEDSPCRKPQPGMLFSAADDLGIDLHQSYLVGDAASDMQAALNAGCQPVMVQTGRGKKQIMQMSVDQLEQCHISRDLLAAVRWIISDRHRKLKGNGIGIWNEIQ